MDYTMIPLLDREDYDDLEAHGMQMPPAALEITSPPMLMDSSRFEPRTPPPSPDSTFSNSQASGQWRAPRLSEVITLSRRLSVDSNETVPSMTLDASLEDVSTAAWDTDSSTVRGSSIGVSDDDEDEEQEEAEIEIHFIDYEDDLGFQHVEFTKDVPFNCEENHLNRQSSRRWSPRWTDRPTHQFYGLSSYPRSNPYPSSPIMRPIASLRSHSIDHDFLAITDLPLPSRSAPSPPTTAPVSTSLPLPLPLSLPLERRLTRRTPRKNTASFDSYFDITSDTEDTFFARSVAFTSKMAKRLSIDQKARRIIRRNAHRLVHSLTGVSRVHKSRKSNHSHGHL